MAAAKMMGMKATPEATMEKYISEICSNEYSFSSISGNNVLALFIKEAEQIVEGMHRNGTTDEDTFAALVVTRILFRVALVENMLLRYLIHYLPVTKCFVPVEDVLDSFINIHEFRCEWVSRFGKLAVSDNKSTSNSDYRDVLRQCIGNRNELFPNEKDDAELRGVDHLLADLLMLWCRAIIQRRSEYDDSDGDESMSDFVQGSMQLMRLAEMLISDGRDLFESMFIVAIVIKSELLLKLFEAVHDITHKLHHERMFNTREKIFKSAHCLITQFKELEYVMTDNAETKRDGYVMTDNAETKRDGKDDDDMSDESRFSYEPCIQEIFDKETSNLLNEVGVTIEQSDWDQLMSKWDDTMEMCCDYQYSPGCCNGCGMKKPAGTGIYERDEKCSTCVDDDMRLEDARMSD